MKKRGFTLVELLAVMVIMGIIAVIAIPVAISWIEDSRVNSFRNSVLSAYNSLDIELLQNNKPTNGNIEINAGELNVKNGFIGGSFIIGDKNQTTVNFIENEEYCAYGTIEEFEVRKGCHELDTTPPVIDEDEIHVQATSRTITVILGSEFAVEDRSEITKYKVYLYLGEDLKGTKESSSNTITFDKVTHDTEYSVIVEAINENGLSNKSGKKYIKTTLIDPPTYSVNPSGWAQSKAVTITYPEGYTNEYCINEDCLNKIWKPYNGSITMNSTGYIIARVTDGTNYVEGSSLTVSEIDTTKPTTANFTYAKTSNSLTIIADGKDPESGITHYAFSKDGGSTWTEPQESKTYKFTGLTTGAYNIKVRVYNGTYGNNGESGNYLDSETQVVETVIIAKPTCGVSPSGWSQDKTVTCTYPEGYTNDYSIDGGETWTPYTGAVKFEANGALIARVNDGVNYVISLTENITTIDTTAPTQVSFSYSKTTNSITINASGIDNESRISRYAFSKDGGTTWTTPQTSSSYTFTNLNHNASYNIKVRVWNGTYVNNGSSKNYMTSGDNVIKTNTLDTPTYDVSPEGWAQSKTVTITYPTTSGLTKEYSIDGGETWKTYSSAIKFTANGTIIARVNDGHNCVTASSQTVSKIDTTAPTASNFTYEITTKSITVTASGTDNQSGISRYAFSKDGGTTWTSAQTSNTYIFDNLETGEYAIKVRVYNGTYVNNGSNKNYLDSSSQNISTVPIDTPTYSVSPEGWAQSKTVEITYPTTSGLTKQYSIDGGTTWDTYTSGVEFTSNGTIIARVTDGKNTVTASSQTVSQVDATAPTAATVSSYSRTTKSIKITASGIDNESGILRYSFRIYDDEWTEWTTPQKSTSYTFNNLNAGQEYRFQVRVYNGTYVNGTTGNYKDSATWSIPTRTMDTPTYEVSPEGWAQSKTVEITYPTATGLTKEYSTDGGETWTTYSSAVKFTANGTIIARVNDGYNYVTSSSQTVSEIDTTAPTEVSAGYGKTTNSITVTAGGTDPESGIIRYAFSKDGGTTWTEPQESRKYTFSGLTTGTYNIKVRVYNGTYINNGGSGSYRENSGSNISTTTITTPTYEVSPSGWSQSKTVEITYPTTSGLTKEYSIDGGTTWKTYSDPVKLTSNGTIIARVTDGTNTVTASSQAITEIDTTSPTQVGRSITKTTNSITIKASSADSESGISYFAFSKDGGKTWTSPQTASTYTFSNLVHNSTYSIGIKAWNGTYANDGDGGYRNSMSITFSVTTAAIESPTCEVSPSGWSQSKKLTCTYPEGYTNEYSIDGGSTWKTYSGTVSITANGTIIARVNDGYNYVTSSSQTVSEIDTTAPTAASFTNTKTTKSITVTASGTDSESGIARYAFSKDGGSTWTSAQSSNTYTFSSLKTGSYSIKVRVWNGTYVNGTTGNYKDSTTSSVSTLSISTPTYEVDTKEFVTSKTLTIIYPTTSGLTKQYSTDGGTTWKTYTGPITVTNITTFIARVTDGTNTVTASSYTVTKVGQTSWTFNYTGAEQSITVPADGYYKVQAWGAQGGSSVANGDVNDSGGKGAYTSGKIYLTAGTKLVVDVGGKGTSAAPCTIAEQSGGYNGGGTGSKDSNATSDEETACMLEGGGGGGGMTSIKTVNGAYLMIAAGGGGSSNTYAGGSGGTLYGLNGTWMTASSDGTTYSANYQTYNGSTWYGGMQSASSSANFTKYYLTGGNAGNGNNGGAGGSGAGLFGGNATNYGTAGHGGSSWMRGYAGAAEKACYSTTCQEIGGTTDLYFIDGKMVAGIKEGSGRVEINWLSENKPSRSWIYDDVRYIKDCTTGFTRVNTSAAVTATAHWNEIQAMVNGVNVAKGATITGETSAGATTSISNIARIVDGNIAFGSYAEATGASAGKCVVIDLGSNYNLDEIAVWHYFGNLNSRYYNDHKLSVSSNKSMWLNVGTDVQLETPNGQRYSAYSSKEFVYTYQYQGKGGSGRGQVFVAPYNGTYKIELWGAKGGRTGIAKVAVKEMNYGIKGGNGGYVSGTISMTAGTPYYIYVGGKGNNATGGYNGGAAAGATNYRGGGGGGATDIRTDPAAWDNATGLTTRIAVAAGGGGAGGIDYYSNTGDAGATLGGYNGGAAGVEGFQYTGYRAGAYGGSPGTTTAGGAGGLGAECGRVDAGGTYYTGSGGGGGGGYYGGGGGGGGALYAKSTATSCNVGNAGKDGTLGIGGAGGDSKGYNSYLGVPGGGGGGGANYVGGLTSTTNKNGNVSIPTVDGFATKTGNNENGYAKITFVG